MTEIEALQEITLDKLTEHCYKQCKKHKNTKYGYEHYVFLKLLDETYEKQIQDYLIDYSLICNGELKL